LRRAADVALLVNPTAGRGRGARWSSVVADRLGAAGSAVEVLVGSSADDALALARTAVAAGVPTLVAVGGDGLVHVAVQAVAGQPVLLGLVPAGTGNDFARALGIPLGDPLAAADIVLAGHSAAVDAGRVTGPNISASRLPGPNIAERWFAGVLAAGFDSQVNERANTMRGRAGRGTYVLAMLSELRTLRPIPYEVTIDGERLDLQAVLVAVANIASYGGGMRIAPSASPTDGLLEVTVVGAVSRTELVRVFPRIYNGSFVRHPAVRQLRARDIGLAADGVVAYADGERIGPLPLTVSVVPGALRVAVPR